VSLWLRNTLQIELAPDQVNLVHTERKLTLRGMRNASRNQLLFSAAGAESGSAPWSGALQALEKALPTEAGRPDQVCVILSSRLVRHVLVPWSDALSDTEEELAFARHCFDKVYGEAAAQWELRLSPDRDRAPMLASAVDAGLLGALHRAFDAAGVRLDSIQPNLMAVYNDYRRLLRNRSAWLALVEPGYLTLALLHQGRWVRIRSQRIDSGWRKSLSLILEREMYLADPAVAARDVFVWASGMNDVSLPEDERWQFQLLSSRPRHGLAPADQGRFLAAMEG
jgi:hypothetical protein